MITAPPIVYCPVRHHSPRSSVTVLAELNRSRPSVVLIEGPRDALRLVDVLLDRDTRPPVAILGYRTDGTVGSCLWPFAEYSPEYVALKWAKEHGAEARFVDIPIGVALASTDEPNENEASENATVEGPAAPPDNNPEPHELLGYRSFEEFWEARLEAPAYDAAEFREAILGYAAYIRTQRSRPYDRARDTVMYKAIQAELEHGTPGSKIAFVAGAAHVSALITGEIDLSADQSLPAPVPSMATLIPFSFPRLSEMFGYGAGNRAPRFYQRAHEVGCDYERATLDMILEVCTSMRDQGFTASLAEAVEAYRLAKSLASLRDKPGPGFDELRESVIATIGRGESTAVDRALTKSTLGTQVGKVASRIGQNSLQREFWKEIEAHQLPRQDRPSQVLLHLSQPDESAAARFLQRLRVSKIPFATFVGLIRSAPVPHEKRPAAGGIEALRRATEAWEIQWTPATDVALVERIVLGDTLEQVTTKTLNQRLDDATTTRQAADILLDAVLASCIEAIHRALDVCESLARDDEDIPSLAGACASLSALISFGAHHALSDLISRALQPLCRNTFRRAALRIKSACDGDDEAVAPIKTAMRALHEVALAQSVVDADLWWDTAQDISNDFSIHPSAAGFATGLLHISDKIQDDAVGQALELRLSSTHQPERAAGFLEGFLEVSAASIVRSAPVIRALDGYFSRLGPESFRDQLPTLRRALGPLSVVAKRYLLETVISVRGLGAKKAPVEALSEQQQAQLHAVTEDLSKVMDDLDDLL